ncbi:MAG: glycosyltransferase [Clostridiaceae bacterium]
MDRTREIARSLYRTAYPLLRTGCFWEGKGNVEKEKKYLQSIAPKPLGTCFADNMIVDSDYDLQIVIPAYNAEKYIERCLDSVIGQKTKYRFVAIVINDGSKDSTAALLEKYNEYPFINIINQENRGFSGARNRGIQRLMAPYIAFLDSDDVLPTNAVDNMLNTALEFNADIAEGSYYTFTDEEILDTFTHSLRQTILDPYNKMAGFPWGKIYSSKILQHFCFPEGFWFEDTAVAARLMFHKYHYAVFPEMVYGYRINPNGITLTAIKHKKSIDTYWITEKLLEELRQHGIQYTQELYEYILKQVVMNYMRTRKMKLAVRKSIFVLTADLFHRYLNSFATMNYDLADLEAAMKTGNYVRYELFMMKYRLEG